MHFHFDNLYTVKCKSFIHVVIGKITPFVLKSGKEFCVYHCSGRCLSGRMDESFKICRSDCVDSKPGHQGRRLGCRGNKAYFRNALL